MTNTIYNDKPFGKRHKTVNRIQLRDEKIHEAKQDKTFSAND